MKTKITTLVLLFLFACVGLAQDSIKTEKLNNYKNILGKYRQNFDEKSKEVIRIEKEVSIGKNKKPIVKNRTFIANDTLFKIIVKAIYEACEIDPVELRRTINQDPEKNKKEIKEDVAKNQQIEKPYGLIEGAFEGELKKHFSNTIYLLTRIPVYVKAKVLSIRQIEEYNTLGGHSIRSDKYIIRLQAEKVIKGKIPLIEQPEFEVYYRYWEPVSKDYIVGNSYLFLIWNRDVDDTPWQYAVATFIDEHGGRLLVKNNILYDDYNIFGLGKEVKWTDFVNAINDKIYRIKNLMDY
jgi:hypothetical protein